jgi:hypothetical protein
VLEAERIPTSCNLLHNQEPYKYCRCQVVSSTQSVCISSCLFLHRFCYPVVPVFPSLTLLFLSTAVLSVLTLVPVSSPSCPQSCFPALDPCSTASLDSAPDLLTQFLISLPTASVWIPYYPAEVPLDCTPSPFPLFNKYIGYISLSPHLSLHLGSPAPPSGSENY